MRPSTLAIFVLLGTITTINSYRNECSKSEYNRCVKMADPLIREAHLIFPDNVDDLLTVCDMWKNLIDCLEEYTNKCFTDQQKKQFNKAVETPIGSVHQMCAKSRYRSEYLQHAPCIKSTITQKSHCGPQYSLLVEQVAQGEVISKTTLCCSHDRFKQCVQQETRRLCDRGLSDGPAARFATQTINKALSFLQDQCYNYIPNSGDCPTVSTDMTYPFSEGFVGSTSSSEVYPWSTIQETAPKEVPPDRMVPPKSTSLSWLPSSTVSAEPNLGHTSFLGSRTRPASYGRSSSWLGEGANQNTVQMGTDTSPTPPTNQNWASMSPRFFNKDGGYVLEALIDPDDNLEKNEIKRHELNEVEPLPLNIDAETNVSVPTTEDVSGVTETTDGVMVTSSPVNLITLLTETHETVAAQAPQTPPSINEMAEKAVTFDSEVTTLPTDEYTDGESLTTMPTTDDVPRCHQNDILVTTTTTLTTTNDILVTTTTTKEELMTDAKSNESSTTTKINVGKNSGELQTSTEVPPTKNLLMTSPTTTSPLTTVIVTAPPKATITTKVSTGRGAPNDNARPSSTEPPATTSRETWYPAAGNQMVNEVDEPNQQGLTKPKNTAANKQLFSLTLIATVLTAFC